MIRKFNRRHCIAAMGMAMLPRLLNAQQGRTAALGILDSSAATAFKLSAFYEALKNEGFAKNQNLTVEYHAAAGDYGRLPELAADLVKRPLNLITAFGTPAALAAKAVTTSTPVVFAIDANPIDIGLVASLNHRGANMTGVAGMATGRERKRLELLHEAVPAAPVLGFLFNPRNVFQDALTQDVLAFAQKIAVQVKAVQATSGSDFPNVFNELTQSRAGGLVIADDELFLSLTAELGSLAARRTMPAIFQGAPFAAAGGLMTYGTRLAELYHQAGTYSGLVLAGAAPADLPIYQTTRIEMIASLRSAKALGIALPQTITEQATTLIR